MSTTTIKDPKFKEALELICASVGSLQQVAEIAGLSEMYVRKLLVQNEAFNAIERVDIFGRTYYGLDSVRTAVDERSEVINARVAARNAQAEEREAARTTIANTPTLLDLRILARELNIPVSNKTKAVLEIEIKTKQEAIASGDVITTDDDPYSLKTADELRVLCRTLGLKTAGTKPFIIARLQEYDAAKDDAELTDEETEAGPEVEVPPELEVVPAGATVEDNLTLLHDLVAE